MSELGSRVGAFRILSPLGEGRMGKVFLAEDTRLGRKVAIKMVAEARGDARPAEDRLMREAQTASALSHPNICTLFDVGRADGQLYIVMEYVDGLTLRDVTPPGGLPVEDVLAHGTAIARALAHAHGRGVVHRDLKSANVMVSADHQIKVLDFGLAAFTRPPESRQLLEQETLTIPGSIVGTPHYMSPEQLRGEPADPRSDIWALGVVLYEMATKRRPFAGKTTFEISSAVLKDPPAPLPPELPHALVTVIDRCLRKERGRRYQDSGEVLAALEVIQATFSRSGLPPASLTGLPAVGSDVEASSSSLSTEGSLAGQVQSLAVLPLTNLSGDPDQDYFSDGLTEAVINDLAKIAALKVISRTSAMRYKGSEKPLPEIADELGVDAVIEGSVQRVGSEVRINAQLIHAATDTNLWAESYTAKLENILRLQSDVAQAVAQRIHVAITPLEQAQLAPQGVVKPNAHEAYLHARHARNLITRDGFELALDWAREAIAIDPSYARPYELLADVFVLLGMYGFRRPREVFPLAKEHAARALELDELLPDAHSTMGWAVQVHDFDRDTSEREYKRALELNPGHEITLMRYGAFLIGLGEIDGGLALLERSIELDPMAPIMNALYAYGLYLTRDFDGAIAHSHKRAKWEPGFWWSYWNLGEALAAKGEHDEAVAALEKAFALERNPFTGGGLAAAYARAGEPARAAAMLHSMLAKAKERYVPPYFIALVQEALGQREAALDSLEAAWKERDSWFSFAAVTPALDRLRDEPRLRELLKQMGLGEVVAPDSG